MDIFHVKIFLRPGILSIAYIIEKDLSLSHFSSVKNLKGFLCMPGKDPIWLQEALKIQSNNLAKARSFVFDKLKADVRVHNRPISVGFDWDGSDYKYDHFVSAVNRLAGC